MTKILMPVKADVRKDYPALDPESYWYQGDAGDWEGPYQTLEELNAIHVKREESSIRCNQCMWLGNEEDLVREKDKVDGEEARCCPNCHTDSFLMDINPKEWSGTPDPKDPDNFWIDDATGERVNAVTNERTKTRDVEFSGYHAFIGENGKPYGSFEVFYTDKVARDNISGWYWWSCYPGCLPEGEPMGPFPTAEGAYLDAIGDS